MKYPIRGIRSLECYSVDELARATGRAKSTVNSWLSDGLAKLDQGRPVLVFGGDYILWAKAKRSLMVQHEPDEIRCQACKTYQVPKDRIIMLLLENGKPRASGVCSNCGRDFSLYFSLHQLEDLEGKLEVLRE